MFISLEDEYKQASSAVEYMRKNAKHYKPDEEEREFHKLAHSLRQTAYNKKNRLHVITLRLIELGGASSYRTMTAEQDMLMGEVLVRCYKIFKYKSDFDFGFDDTFVYDEEGNESLNPKRFDKHGEEMML